MSKKDGKSKFYRTLNLDKESCQILKWYRKNIDKIRNEEKKNGQ
ncbi:MAG: hypothetical protein ACTSYZ_12615 [Candidatus Helarchaeota archaeon]